MKYQIGDYITITKLYTAGNGRSMEEELLNTSAKIESIEDDCYMVSLEVSNYIDSQPWRMEIADSHSELDKVKTLLYGKDLK